MPTDSGFRRLPDHGAQRLHFTFEGEVLSARRGDSLAAALLAAGHGVTRATPVSGAARGPYCLMGACFECLLEVDGQPNVQACMAPVHEGMQARRMRGARTTHVDNA